MALYRSFDEVVDDLGAVAHWPMTGQNPINDEVIGATPLTITSLSTNVTSAPQDRSIFPNINAGLHRYAGFTAGSYGIAIKTEGLRDYAASQGWGGFTISVFSAQSEGGNTVCALGLAQPNFINLADRFDMGDSGDPDDSATIETSSLRVDIPNLMSPDRATHFCITVDNEAGTAFYMDGYRYLSVDALPNEKKTDVIWGAFTNIAFTLWLGHLLVFPRALDQGEVGLLNKSRRFLGHISGSVTLDGGPTEGARIRAFRRTDGAIAGETTAAEDGSYELGVFDNVQMDLLAIPPDGVSARPLAHGPILPKPYEQ